MNKGTVYFRDGELVAKSGSIKVYSMNEELFMEVGPGHNLLSSERDVADYVWQIVDKPFGNCLIIGLGLGVSAKYILSLPKIKSLVVLEENMDVIEGQMTANPIKDPRFNVINGEILPFL